MISRLKQTQIITKFRLLCPFQFLVLLTFNFGTSTGQNEVFWVVRSISSFIYCKVWKSNDGFVTNVNCVIARCVCADRLWIPETRMVACGIQRRSFETCITPYYCTVPRCGRLVYDRWERKVVNTHLVKANATALNKRKYNETNIKS